MGNWIEIFRGDRQVDSEGKVQNGDQWLDQAVTKFNATEPVGFKTWSPPKNYPLRCTVAAIRPEEIK